MAVDVDTLGPQGVTVNYGTSFTKTEADSFVGTLQYTAPCYVALDQVQGAAGVAVDYYITPTGPGACSTFVRFHVQTPEGAEKAPGSFDPLGRMGTPSAAARVRYHQASVVDLRGLWELEGAASGGRGSGAEPALAGFDTWLQ